MRRVLGDHLSTVRTTEMRHQGCMVYLGKVDGSGLTARSGTTPGTGTVTLYEIASSVLTARQNADSTDVDVTVYNLSDRPVPASTYTLLLKEMLTGNLYVSDTLATFHKLLVRFTLDSALSATDASKAATITDQYSVGVDNSTAITVHNLLTSTASTYLFAGDSGDAGLAIWDTGTNYRIIQLECP